MSSPFEIRKTLRLAAGPATVFQALTDPARIVAFFPYRTAESEGRPGGEIVLRGELDGQPFADYGVIEAFEPGRLFQYRYWSDNHGTPRTPEHHMRLRYELHAAAAGGTELDLTHSGAASEAYAAGMRAAWDGLLASLRAYLDG